MMYKENDDSGGRCDTIAMLQSNMTSYLTAAAQARAFLLLSLVLFLVCARPRCHVDSFMNVQTDHSGTVAFVNVLSFIFLDKDPGDQFADPGYLLKGRRGL